jgi:hypothetical protein
LAQHIKKLNLRQILKDKIVYGAKNKKVIMQSRYWELGLSG